MNAATAGSKTDCRRGGGASERRTVGIVMAWTSASVKRVKGLVTLEFGATTSIRLEMNMVGQKR